MPSVDFQSVFKRVPGLFLVLLPDAGFTVAAASDAYFSYAKTCPEALIGRALFEAVQDTPENTRSLRTALERIRDGQLRETEANGANTPVVDANGALLYIIHRVEDAENSGTPLRHDKRATEVLENITEGFFILDAQWRFHYVNPAAERILGSTTKNLLGRSLWEAYPGLEDTDFERSYRRTMVGREPSSFTAFYANQDRWYEVAAYPAPEGIAVYFRNVTDQKLAEAERERLIVESERQRRIYEAALSNTPDLVYVFGLDHRFTYANEALLTMWGRTREDALGRTCLELGYEPWHAEMHDREIDQVVATREPIRGEVPFTGTGGRRVYDYIFVPVLGSGGEVVAVAGTTRDVTDRKMAEQSLSEQAEQLKEADRAKDEFLATLSHELRNPLAPLSNALHVLKSAGVQNGVHAESMARIQEMMERQVTHLVRLVDDLLEISRISRGDFTLRKERVPVASIVHNALETTHSVIEAGGHTLELTLPDTPVWVEGDPVRMAQILSNLLNNAAKYTEDKGRIAVMAKAGRDSVAVSVKDSGIGMTPEALPRMFEMFSRGERAGRRNQEGLGVGLALARRLASMHGGTLEASSEGPGKGSEFTLTLPLAGLQSAAETRVEGAEPSIPGQRILVVDDNRDAADSLGMILKVLGADVRIARSGAEALETFATYVPTVVLLDIGMPGMDGYEVARTIRSRHPDSEAFVVALTGWGQDEDRRRARDAGFDHHLIKPADLRALQAILAQAERPAEGRSP